MSGRLISLNVGGTIFTTSKSTLASHPDSMLAKMCDTELPHQRDCEGNIFNDRNHKAFEVILEFLRTGSLFAEESLLPQLQVEADYFGLEELLKIIRERRYALLPPYAELHRD